MTTHAVVDASVVVKWLLRESAHERDTLKAIDLHAAIATGVVEAIQPPHWLAEVSGVMARLEPATAIESTKLLCSLEWPVCDEPDVYLEACRLATRLDHDLFDTLYHAVALCQPETTCITADEAYYRKARGVGKLTLLRDLELH